MTRLWREGEAVTVTVTVAGRPLKLVWHHRVHMVQQVVQQWVVETGWWEAAGAVRRNYYALLTEDGLLCVVYHDLTNDTWWLSKLYD